MSVLQQLIMDEILHRDKRLSLTKKDRDTLCLDLHTFLIASIDKYIAGKKEHGGSLDDRNCLEELYKELIDGVQYASRLRARRKGK
jgi:hypothetical protein